MTRPLANDGLPVLDRLADRQVVVQADHRPARQQLAAADAVHTDHGQPVLVRL
jgi:hypothetical protein